MKLKAKVLWRFFTAVALFVLFLLFTLIITRVDVQAIGPEGSRVGLASLNGSVFSFFGVNLLWYKLADWLGYLAILVAVGFAIAGLVQLIQRKSLWKVDHGILLMGALFIVAIFFYVLFERFVINYRPILMDNELGASYPSSHAVLVIVILVSAMLEFHRLLPGRRALLLLLDILPCILIAATILARLASGAHWLTDIIGGILQASALIMLYSAFLALEDTQAKKA